MAVTEGSVKAGTDGKALDTTTVTQTAGATAHREAVAITDPETLAARAAVLDEFPQRGAYGLVVRSASDNANDEVFAAILFELKLLNARFEEAFLTGLNTKDLR
jgi:hypothetical protein